MADSPSTHRGAIHWGWALLIATTAGIALWARPLVPADETRYAAVAWEMWRDGQWWVPHLNGEIYSHKPPLLFWLMHLGWWLFGVNEWWPRLLGPAAALASAALTQRIGLRLFPERPEIAARAPWLLVGALYWLADATMLMFDHLVTVFVALAWLGLLRMRDGARGGAALTAIAVGIGIMAKGPVVVLFTAPAMLMLLPLGDARSAWRWIGRCAAAGLSGLAIAALWLVPALREGGQAYAHALLWNQGAGRVSESFDHARPLWWYLAVLPLLWLPWSLTPTFWRGLYRGARQGLAGSTGLRFCIGVSGFVFAVISIMSGKQPQYLLPMFPLLALMIAATGAEAGQRLWIALPVAALGLLMLGLPLAAAQLPKLPWAAGVSPLWGIALAATAIALLWRWRGNGTAALALSGLLSAAATLALYTGVARPALERFDLRGLSDRIAAEQARRPVAFAGVYRGQFDFFGRLRQPLQELHGPDIRHWLTQHPDGLIVGEIKRLGQSPEAQAAIWTSPYRSRYFAGWTADRLAAHPDAFAGGGNRAVVDEADPD